jgi:uncharacterized SAM-binding protein YcdF (DUF218 family)
MNQKRVFLKLLFLTISALLICSGCADQKFARKYYAKAQQAQPYDAVIVTGIPYNDTTNSGLIFAARVLWAKYLYDHGIAKNIIFSGSAVSTPYYEGKAMKIVADSLGMPPGHTFSETRAEHSTENVWYGMKMAKKMGCKRIALAADPFQVKMLRGFLKKRCDDMDYIPIIYDSVIHDRNNWHAQIPKVDFTGAFEPKFVSLYVKETFWERFNGTRGKHIKFDEKE